MASPPNDIEPSELFQKLLERPAPSDTFPFPRLDDDGEPLFTVRIFVLTEKQIVGCRAKVRKWLVENTKEATPATANMDAHAEGDRLAKELLANAVFEDQVIGDHPSGRVYRRLFKNADDVEALTSDEVGALYGAYLLTQIRFGPTDVTFTDPKEVNEWVAKLEVGARPFVLPLLQSHQRDQLLLSLVDRVSTTLKLLDSPPESWATSLESLRETWRVGTDSSTSPVADSTPSPSDGAKLITREDAIAMAQAVRDRSRL
jgi:hypothetical protein